jgi:OPA family glycerol-3-phosphate transporter-like MFS transporter
MSIGKTIRQEVWETWHKIRCVVPNSYTYWRWRMMYSLILGYAAFYLVRQNFPMAMPGICEDFGTSKTDLGWILTFFSVVYGVGKFINGYLSDRSNARYFMAFGLMGSACCALAAGMSQNMIMLGVFWGLNAWFQSMGWPPSARLLTHWFSPRELGTKWALWSCSHQIGSAAITILAGWLIILFGWRWAFIVPAWIAFICGVWLLNRLRDNPQDVGLPSVDTYKDEPPAPPSQNQRPRADLKEIWQDVFCVRWVWYVALANMFLYIPRVGVMNWAPTFLKEVKGVSLLVSGLQVAVFDIAGLFGGIMAGVMSDRFFQNRRGPVATLYLFGLSLSILLLWKIPGSWVLADTFWLLCAGFFVSGPQVLVGIAMADFSSRRVVGVATGFAGIMGSGLGAAFSGVGVGTIADRWGWDGVFALFIGSAILGAFFFALTWFKRPRSLEGPP